MKPRESTDRLSHVVMISTLTVIAIFLFSMITSATEFGRYVCRVEKTHGTDALGRAWEGGKLIYDADAGTLDGSFDPGGHLAKQGIELPLKRLFSRLKVETPPSTVNNLVAVQYEPADGENIRPVVAWLMLETLDDRFRPRFKFFSNTIRVVVEGRCIRH